MKTYKIAELIVQMNLQYSRTTCQAQRYLLDANTRPAPGTAMGLTQETAAQDADRKPDIVVDCSSEELLKMQRENPHLSLNDCEYIRTGAIFYEQLLNFQGCMLHASSVAYENQAYLFSAPCGTGKSTHTRLWQYHFGKQNVAIINDDKPALRLVDHQFFAYGTPWSGKSDKNLNIKVPLKAIVCLQQSPTNWIRPMLSEQAIFAFLNQTLHNGNQKMMGQLLTFLDLLFQAVPVWEMGCTISTEAVQMAWEKISR